MLRHIVSLRMDAATDSERDEKAARLSAALAGLPAVIPEIRELSVNGNVVIRPGNWDLALVVDLDDADALEVYRAHPEHLKVLALIDEVVADRCAVDFLI